MSQSTFKFLSVGAQIYITHKIMETLKKKIDFKSLDKRFGIFSTIFRKHFLLKILIFVFLRQIKTFN